MPASAHPTTLARVLDEDRDLADVLEPARLTAVQARAVAPVVSLPAGEWPAMPRPREPVLGLLVLDGILGSRVELTERAHLELVSTGDVLRPWVGLGADASVPVRFGWCVYEAVRLAVLDRRFLHAVRDAPEIHEALMERAVLRSRRLNFQLAVNSVMGIEERILLVLWHFGERWGRVTAAGVNVTFPLTHRDLADVVGATRPSVSSALMELRRQDVIEQDGRGWLLKGSPPERFMELKAEVELVPSP
jgi:CRP/FNR family cyclic AMP-dependent transcriptional regulator